MFFLFNTGRPDRHILLPQNVAMLNVASLLDAFPSDGNDDFFAIFFT